MATYDPYHRWLSIPPGEQPPHCYRLLGLSLFECDPDVIRDAAEQRMAHVRTYQLGPHADLSQQILNELAAAKICLSDPERKAKYDELLREQLRRVGEAPQPPRLPVQLPSRPDRSRRVVFATVASAGILLGIAVVMVVQWSRVRTIPPPTSTARVDLARAPSPPQPAVVKADDRLGPPQADRAKPAVPVAPPAPPKRPEVPAGKDRVPDSPPPVITPPPPPTPPPAKPTLPVSLPEEKPVTPSKPPHDEESPPAPERNAASVEIDKPRGSPSTSSDRLRRPNLSGTWRSQLGSVYRLTDEGDTITVVLVTSPDLRKGDGVLVREGNQLVAQQWRCVFKTDPRKRWWDLRFQARIRDEKTLDVQFEMLSWDARWNVYDRRFPTEGVWRKIR